MYPKMIRMQKEKIAAFCHRWNIVEFALFGSVLREDFRADSDMDVLVTFSDDVQWTLLDHVEMQDELKNTFGREVDFVSRRGIERSRNTIRREAILSSAEVVYAQP